jgi:2-methylcitrate synthase
MVSKGLTGISAGDSKISTVGLGSGLNYRGYNIKDLAEKSTFEEVLHLLLFERLPTQQELDELIRKISQLRNLPQNLKAILENLPANSHPMDVLRTTCSALGTIEPESTSNNQFEITIRLIAIFGPALLYWYHFHKSNRLLKINTNTGTNDTVASNFVKLLYYDGKEVYIY